MNILNRSMAAGIAFTACAALIGASNLFAQDWPQWRGLNRDGKVSGFHAPEKWPANLVRKWTTPVGKGDSSPVLVGERLYAFGRQATDEVVLCLNSATGKILWEAKYPADYVVTGPPVRHPGPRSTPVVADGKVCTLGVGGKGLYAVKIEARGDGCAATPLWENTKLGARFTTPVLKDGALYGYNGSFFCASAKTGETLWTDATKSGQSAALVDAGSQFLALTQKGGFVAFKPSQTEYTELARIQVASAELWAHPLVAGNRIFIRDGETVGLWTVD